ncbi:hypothetical protein FB45DRAFT_1022421 [Roridomyces roridus]|uniref:Uncharacterized protein n=1 Tax=Roridomyces roridus TaxID=1738132 RepID=A0AAD7C7Y8_9AGAR|nr:hypothetical protein FB45DRAFT_1022421 [Roridomyces roridus]
MKWLTSVIAKESEWFPAEIPTHPLLGIDYLLVEGNEAEIDKLWGAATQLGFWHLKNHGARADDFAEGMFQMARETMLSLRARRRGKLLRVRRYKATGAIAVCTGRSDTVELINIAKDDALAWPQQARHAYPSTVYAHMEETIFSDRLGLPPDALEKRHLVDEYSGSQTRVIKNPPSPQEPPKVAIGAHTDFGSLSLLHSRLGGHLVAVDARAGRYTQHGRRRWEEAWRRIT